MRDSGRLDPARGIGQVEPAGVQPEFKRKGIGAALLGELLTRFRGLGATHGQVEAEPGNLAAIRAYQRSGFRLAHTVRACGRLYAGRSAVGSCQVWARPWRSIRAVCHTKARTRF